MKKRISLAGFTKVAALSTAVFGATCVQAQTAQNNVFLDWSSSAGSQNFFQKSVTKTDGSNNVFIAGATVNGAGNYDIMVAKYSPDGALAWYQQYAGSGGGNDFATALTIDGSGNVIITGSVFGSTASDSNNVITIKYNSNGTQQWVSTYHGGTGNDVGTDLIADGSGNIYVCGSANKGSTNQFDAILVKYNSSGTQQWVVNYNYNNLWDGAYRVIMIAGGKIAITSVAQNSSTNYKLAIARYDSNGGFVSATVSGSNNIGFTMVYGCTVDNQHNMYVTGSTLGTSSVDYYTIKLDSALTQVWTATYNGSSNLTDEAKGIVLDASGNVYITGYSTTSTQGKDYVTIKYNSSGTQQWVKVFNGAAGKDDEGNAIAIDGSGNPVVTGASNNGDSHDYYTIKYDASGNIKWQMSWNAGVNKADRGMDVAVDNTGAVIVTGQSTAVNGLLNYVTLKYVERSVLMPSDAEPLHPAFCFTENRGQLFDTDNKAIPDILFYNAENAGHVQLYYTNSKLSYVFARLDTATTSPVDSLERIDMTYANGSNEMRTYPMEQRSDYMNYFKTNIPEGRARVKNYNKAFVSDVYDRIDVIHTSNGKGLKYYYIVKPGGDPADIEETYSGANNVYVDSNGDLVVEGILGEIRHPEPKVWQIDNSGNVYSLSWTPTYSVNGSAVTLGNIGTFNSAYNLIVQIDLGVGTATQQDPNDNLEWATHYGSLSGGNTPMYDVETDADSCSYFSGSAAGNNFPVSNLGLQTQTGGASDGAFMKFKPNCVREWATYMGGSPVEEMYFIDLDTAKNIYFAGRTQGSGSLVFYMPGAYIDSTFNGGLNDFNIGKINAAGTAVLWSTYYGGNNHDGVTDILVTPTANRLYVLGHTWSTNFPYCSKSGAYNSNSSSGAVIVEFDASMDTVWSTHFGSASGPFVEGIDGNMSEGFFLVGKADAGLPYVQQTGGYFDNSPVSDDAWVAHLDANDSITWCTSFGGAFVDKGWDIALVGKDIYIVGETSSNASSFPILADTSIGEYRDWTLNQNNPDGFIAKFSVLGVQKWTSYFGGANSDGAYKVTSDKSKTVYISGSTLSWDYDMQPYGNAYQQTPNTAYGECYFASFSPGNALLWSTGFGGTQFESYGALATFGNEHLYFSGNSYSLPNTFPWDFPIGGWIDTFKVNTAQSTGYIGRFGVQNINVGAPESPANGFSFLAYPNPTENNLVVSLSGLYGDDVEIIIVDVLGREVMRRKAADVFGTLRESFDFTALSSGIYMVMVNTSLHGSATQKVIKQ